MESCALTSKFLQDTSNPRSNLRKYELVRNGAEMWLLRKKNYFPSTFGKRKKSVLQVKWVYCHLKFSNSKQREEKSFQDTPHSITRKNVIK